MRNLNALTRREKQVAEFVELGFTNLKIAEMLGISRHTVKRHVSNIMSKMAVAGRKELADALDASFESPSASIPEIATWQPWK